MVLAHLLSNGGWERPAHLLRLERYLRGMATGRYKRVIVTMPPRHGKSELCSHWFPAWFLGTYPDQRIILSSYEASFAASWGRKVRDSLAEAYAQGLFPQGVRQDVSSASEWQVAGRDGGMITAGVGGAITGRGGHLLIDDPVKNSEEANSLTYREKAWEWYLSTALTRVEPDCWQLLIMTRWHEDDLVGRLLVQAPEDWAVVNLPALAEEGDPLERAEGEALWPARFDAAALAERRAALGSYWWNALYQQRPSAREGGYFKREWFGVPGGAAPAGKTLRVRRWDCAATEDGGDYTVGALMALTADGQYVVEDVQRVQSSPWGVDSLIRQTAALDGKGVAIREEQEPGSSGKTVVANRARALQGWDYRGRKSSGDKSLRAAPFAAQAEAGNVRLLGGAWNRELLDELCAFPHGAHDDQVDACAGAFADLLELAKRGSRVARSYQG